MRRLCPAVVHVTALARPCGEGETSALLPSVVASRGRPPSAGWTALGLMEASTKARGIRPLVRCGLRATGAGPLGLAAKRAADGGTLLVDLPPSTASSEITAALRTVPYWRGSPAGLSPTCPAQIALRV